MKRLEPNLKLTTKKKELIGSNISEEWNVKIFETLYLIISQREIKTLRDQGIDGSGTSIHF